MKIRLKQDSVHYRMLLFLQTTHSKFVIIIFYDRLSVKQLNLLKDNNLEEQNNRTVKAI